MSIPEEGDPVDALNASTVEPAEAPRQFYDHCITIFREAKDAVNELASNNAAPVGVLRIAAPDDYGASKIAPVAAFFTRK